MFSLSPRRTRRVVFMGDDPAVGEALASFKSKRVRYLIEPASAAKVRKHLLELIRARKPSTRHRKHKAKKFGAMLGDCPAMREVYTLIAKVAPTDASILILGESGTGKELVANAVHERSNRKDKRFVALNCGAIAENLIESELFGHEKGAFTGADRMRKGVFERANGGTLFLDEVAEMAPELQIRLLRILETGVLNRVGGEKDIKVDVRVIAATNRDVNEAVKEGQLREDLLYRLSVMAIELPPLRERGDDVILLANQFLSEHNQEAGTNKSLSPLAVRRLRAYHWPGNVRQLRNMIHRSFIVEDDTMELGFIERLVQAGEQANGIAARESKQAHPPRDSGQTPAAHADAEVPPQVVVVSQGNHAAAVPDNGGEDSNGNAKSNGEVQVPVGTSIDEAEEQLIKSTLEAYNGDKRKTAEVLGISLKTLYNRLKEYENEAAQCGDG